MQNHAQKSHVKTTLIILLLVTCVMMIAIYFSVIRPHNDAHSLANVKIDGIYLPIARDVNDFKLVDQHGKPFSKENLKGHWTMLFFGFTNCAMVCPTTMDALNKMYSILDKELPKNKLPQVVLISVDPERDTVEKMNDYINSFNTNFLGARGKINETVNLEKQLHIVAAKIQADGEGKNHYTINHSAEILIFNPEAKLQAFLSYPHQPMQMAKDYQSILHVFKE